MRKLARISSEFWLTRTDRRPTGEKEGSRTPGGITNRLRTKARAPRRSREDTVAAAAGARAGEGAAQRAELGARVGPAARAEHGARVATEAGAAAGARVGAGVGPAVRAGPGAGVAAGVVPRAGAGVRARSETLDLHTAGMLEVGAVVAVGRTAAVATQGCHQRWTFSRNSSSFCRARALKTPCLW